VAAEVAEVARTLPLLPALAATEDYTVAVVAVAEV
jgi:hypothetical protein